MYLGLFPTIAAFTTVFALYCWWQWKRYEKLTEVLSVAVEDLFNENEMLKAAEREFEAALNRGSSNELRRERIKALEREIEELEETISRRSFFGR